MGCVNKSFLRAITNRPAPIIQPRDGTSLIAPTDKVVGLMSLDITSSTFLEEFGRLLEEKELLKKLWNLKKTVAAELANFLDKVHKLLASIFTNYR
jgi:hypothetical protein